MTELTPEARAIVQAARDRVRRRAASYQPPDYKAANEKFQQQKTALEVACRSGDASQVILEVKKAVHEWRDPPFNGAWPDDWAMWQRALDDALPWNARVEIEDL